MNIRLCLVTLCLLVFYCSAVYGQTTEWEYRQILNPSYDLLNHYGKYGWEIAAATGEGSNTLVFMKRGKSHPLFGTKMAEMPAPLPIPPPKPTCKLTLAQAPDIRG